MKKIIVLIALLATVQFSFAKLMNEKETLENTKLNITLDEATSTFNLTFVSDIEEGVTINIYNVEGTKIFTDKIQGSSSFQRPYNFSNLEKGEYRFEVVAEDGTITRSVVYNTTSSEFIDRKIDNIQVDMETLEANKINLKVYGANQSPIKIAIKTASGEVIYNDNIANLNSFEVTFDLAKVVRTAASLEVSSFGTVIESFQL